jgi:hypothetical protein
MRRMKLKLPDFVDAALDVIIFFTVFADHAPKISEAA